MSGVPLTTALLGIYRDVDAAFERWLGEQEGITLSCRKQCAACCELLALATWPEALLIAEDLQARGLVERFLPALTEQAAQAMRTGDQRSYFDARVRCAFLEEDRTCAIYPVRPTACRYHVAFSDPALCGDRTPGTETLNADSAAVQLVALGPLLREIVEQTPPEEVERVQEMAPVPVMVLAALRELGALSALGGSRAATPAEWMKRWGERTLAATRGSRRPAEGGRP